MIIKSIKTSELYVVGFVLAIWGLDRLGIDVGQVLAVLLDLRTTAADVARELQSIEQPKGTAGYWLAAAWLAARTVLKARAPGQTGSSRSKDEQSSGRDPYRAWRESTANDLPERPVRPESRDAA
jgi:hypothetical protein